MQERDVVKIETKFVRDIVSKLIEKALRKSTNSDVDIQIGKLEIVNADGNIHINLNGNVEISTNKFNLKKPLKLSNRLSKTVLSSIAKSIIISRLKSKLGCKFDFYFYFNEIKYCKNAGKAYIYLDAEAEIKTKDFELILTKIT